MITRCCVCKIQEKDIADSALKDHCFHTLDEMIHEGAGEGNITTKCYENRVKAYLLGGGDVKDKS